MWRPGFPLSCWGWTVTTVESLSTIIWSSTSLSANAGIYSTRPYRKNDNAHIEQKNLYPGAIRFGYERYDNPQVVPLINGLCQGALNQLLNYFLPTMKLEKKERVGSKVVRKYGEAATPLKRVLACPQVSAEKKEQLRKQREGLNPFALKRAVDLQLKEIKRRRRLRASWLWEWLGYNIRHPKNGSEGDWTDIVFQFPSFPIDGEFG